MYKVMFLLSMLSVMMLSGCGSLPVVESTTEVLPEQATQKDVPALEIPTQSKLFPVGEHEQARDLVVAHVARLADLPLPEGEWVFQDQSGQNPDGTLSWLFTDGPWVVQVSAPAISPEPMEYLITVDHMSAIIRWEGRIDSFGKITETHYVRGSQPESPAKPEEPSIEGVSDEIDAQLDSFIDTGLVIKVWGELLSDVPDTYGSQLLVKRIDAY